MVSSESWNLGKQLRQGPVDPMMEVQDETSGCAFDGSYELIYNGRPSDLVLPRDKDTGTSHRLPDYFLVISVTIVSGWLFTYFLDTNLPVFALLWILRVEPFFAMLPSSRVWIHRAALISS